MTVTFSGTPSSEELDGLADGNDPAADVVEIGSRDDALSAASVKRRQHDFTGLPRVDGKEEFVFFAKLHKHGVAIAGSFRPTEQKTGPGREKTALVPADLDGEVTGPDQ